MLPGSKLPDLQGCLSAEKPVFVEVEELSEIVDAIVDVGERERLCCESVDTASVGVDLSGPLAD